jgi:ubiquinone/menaquinone biosynthesis C-methylase UbiE
MISKKREQKIIKEWNKYWIEDAKSKRYLYNLIARFYRKIIIRRSLNYFINKHFNKNSKLIHAGCGSGEVDKDIQNFCKITGVDISSYAVKLYKKNIPKNKIIKASIFNLPIENHSVDGIYNLGVMEHYTYDEIDNILKEFKRVLKKKGKIVLFWPPEFGTSVLFFKFLVVFTKNILRIKNVKFHPDEISRIKSKREVIKIMKKAKFEVIDYYFGIKDLFTYCVIVAKRD